MTSSTTVSSTSTTLSYTTLTVVTSATLTTVTSTTTLAAMGLSVTPSALTSCNALLVKASPPTTAQTLQWSCSPEAASICTAIVAAVSGNFDKEVILDEDAVAAASVSTSAEVTVTLRVDALGDGGQLVSYAERAFVFDPSVSQLLEATAGATTFTLLDANVRLAVALDSCELVPSSQLVVDWSYANTTAGPWTTLTSSSSVWPQLTAPVTDFPGLGSYVVRAVMPYLSSTPEVTFSITLEDVPGPVVELLAPAKVGLSCDYVLDASGSYDSGSDSDLAFSWNCTASGASAQDASACLALAAGATSDTLPIAGGTLGAGSYTFTVTATAAVSVARRWAGARSADERSASESVTVVVGDFNTPVASLATPAAQASPQKDLSLSAVVTTSSSCQAPVWKAWWLLEETSGNATFLYQVESPVSLSYSAPLPVASGFYSLRLVLSDAPNAGYLGNDALGVYVFDTSTFEVDAVPLDGAARIYPTVGSAATTTFLLSSLDWVDDDIPLQHRFSVSMGTTLTNASSTAELEQASWSLLSAFSLDDNLDSVLLSEVGDFAVRAEARDTLGSVSAAYTFGEIVASTSITMPEMLAVLQQVTTTGNVYTVVAAVTAIADVSQPIAYTNTSLTSGLIASLQEVATESTREASAGITNALTQVLASAMAGNGSGAVPLDVDVAVEAAELMATVALTAAESGEGLDETTAVAMLENGDTLLSSLEGEYGSSGTSSSVTALASAVEASVERTADAIAVLISEGGSTEISSSGINLTVASDSTDNIGLQGTSVADFNVPPLDLSTFGTARRLTAACDSSKVTIQHVKWRVSPHVAAGNASDGGAELASVVAAVTGSSSTDGVTCCDVDTETVQTFNIRVCGQTLELLNLSTPLTFTLALPEKADKNLRLCQYYDPISGNWSSEGCSVTGTYSDRIVCSCSHASSFVGAYGNAPLDTVSDFLDGTNVGLLSAAGFSTLGTGDWYLQPAAVALWVLILIHVALAYVAWWRAHHLGMGFGWGDAILWWNQPDQLESLSDKKTGLARFRPGGDRPILRAAAWLLGVKVNIDEALKKPLLGGLVDLAGLKCLQMTVARGLGLFDADLYLLSEERVRRARATRVLGVTAVDSRGKVIYKDSRNSKPMAQLSRAALQVLETELEQVSQAPAGFRYRFSQFLDFLFMIHPINRLMHYSLELAWTYRFSALANAVFASLALSALVFIRDACTSGVYCATGSIWDTFARDVFVSLLCNTFAALPAWALLRQGKKRLATRIKSKPQEDEQIRKWNQQDLSTLGISGILVLFNILFTIVFIANVSDLDKNRWLLRTVSRSVLAWVVLPAVVALLWTVVAYGMQRSPDFAKRLLEQLRKQLEPPRQFTEIEKKFWNWASSFANPLRLNEESGRPYWVPAPPAPPLDFRSGRAPAPPPMPPPGPAPGAVAPGGWPGHAGPPAGPPAGPAFAPPAPPVVYPESGPAFESLTRLGTPELPQFWEWVTQLRSAAVAEAPPDNNIVGLPMEDPMRRPFTDSFRDRESYVTPDSPGFFGHPGFGGDGQDQFWDWAGDTSGFEEPAPSIPQPSPGFMAEDEFWTWATGLARVQSLEALEQDEETDNQFWDWVSEFPHLQRLQSVEALEDTGRALQNTPMPPAPLDLAMVDLPPPPMQYINPTADGRSSPSRPPRSTPLVPPLPPDLMPEQLSPTGAWPAVLPPPGPPPMALREPPPSLDQAQPVESAANPQFDQWVEQLMASRLPEAPLLAPLAPPRTPGLDHGGFGLYLDVGGAGPSGETPRVTPFDMGATPFNQGPTPAADGPTPAGGDSTPYHNDATPYLSGTTPARGSLASVQTAATGGAAPTTGASGGAAGPAGAHRDSEERQFMGPRDAATAGSAPRPTSAGSRISEIGTPLDARGRLSESNPAPLSSLPTEWPAGQGEDAEPALPGAVASPSRAAGSSPASPPPSAPGQRPAGGGDDQTQSAPTRRI